MLDQAARGFGHLIGEWLVTAMKNSIGICAVTLVSLLSSASAFAGEMILSTRNPSLALNAFGGAQNGTFVRLVNNCSPSNPDCTWRWGVLTK